MEKYIGNSDQFANGQSSVRIQKLTTSHKRTAKLPMKS